MKWGRSLFSLTRSCWELGRAALASGRACRPLTLESLSRREPSPCVVARAARRSPAPRGPAGRGGGRGQHEPGGPASRRRAGGGGRSAAAGHPELPPERRRGPGEPGGWRGGDARPNAGRSGERAAAGARGGPGPDPEGLLASGKGWGWNPNRHVQETSANHLRCLRGWRRSWGDGSKKRKMVTVP